jgi:hypothetical protein
VTPRPSRWRDELVRAALVASLWIPVLGCARALGITDITPAADASTDADAAEKADGMSVDSPVDLSSTDALTDAVSDDGRLSDGANDADANVCIGGDLSNVDAGDFVISFTLQTTQTDQVIALANQRFLCTVGVLWDVRLVNGVIYFEISDNVLGLTFLMSQGQRLADGKPHSIVVSRTNGIAQIDVDGTPSGSIVAQQSLTLLPPLEVDTDVCLGVNQTVALQGGLTNLCVMKR